MLHENNKGKDSYTESLGFKYLFTSEKFDNTDSWYVKEFFHFIHGDYRFDLELEDNCAGGNWELRLCNVPGAYCKNALAYAVPHLSMNSSNVSGYMRVMGITGIDPVVVAAWFLDNCFRRLLKAEESLYCGSSDDYKTK